MVFNRLRKKFLIFWTSLLLAPSLLWAGSPLFTPQDLTIYEIELYAPTKEMRSEIANFIHIDEIDGDVVRAVVYKWGAEQLQKHFPHLILKQEILQESDHSLDFPGRDNLYNNYSEVRQILVGLTTQHPNLVELISLGTSVEGREILGIHFKKALTNPEPLPGIFFVGTHHAREHLSTEVPLKLIQHLVENYQNNPEIKTLVDTRDIYIVPLLNPDGSEFDIQTGRYKMWRKNRANNNNGSFGVDLNRNYGFGWGTGGSSTDTQSDVYMGPKAFSEPEIVGLKNFVEAHPNIRILLSFHTFSELILYPWGHKYDGIGGQDELVYKKMAETMAAWNGYKPEQSSDLYIASGDTCDWAYGARGIFCFTFELSPSSMFGGGFYPGPAMIAKAFQDNIKPILYLIDKAKNPYSVLK
jgi:carboxypeptidase T